MLVIAHHELLGLAAPLLLGASGLTVGVAWRLMTERKRTTPRRRR